MCDSNCDDCESLECEIPDEQSDEWIEYLTGKKFSEDDDLSSLVDWSVPEFPGDHS